MPEYRVTSTLPRTVQNTGSRAVTLARHPDTRSEAVRRVDARVVKMPGAVLALTYTIEGDIGRVRLAAPRPPLFAEGLWQHTCCEIFIARNDQLAYHEFNFAPSSAWAMYAFERYRERAPTDGEALDPRISVRATQDVLELDARIHLDRLSPHHPQARLALALAVVIEHQDGSLAYWALRHPPGAPDFHHPHAFALELE